MTFSVAPSCVGDCWPQAPSLRPATASSQPHSSGSARSGPQPASTTPSVCGQDPARHARVGLHMAGARIQGRRSTAADSSEPRTRRATGDRSPAPASRAPGSDAAPTLTPSTHKQTLALPCGVLAAQRAARERGALARAVDAALLALACAPAPPALGSDALAAVLAACRRHA